MFLNYKKGDCEVNKVVKFFKMLKFVIEYRQFFSLAMIVSLLFASGCAATQGFSPEPNEVGIIMNITKGLNEAFLEGKIVLLQKPDHGYVISWATEQGQAFIFVIKNSFMPKGLIAGANRAGGILDQFKNDGWLPVTEAQLTIIMAKLMSLPFPTLLLFPVNSLPNLDNFLNPPPIQS